VRIHSCASTDPGDPKFARVGNVPSGRIVGRSAYRALRGPALNVPPFPIRRFLEECCRPDPNHISWAPSRSVAELSKNDAERALAALDDIGLEELNNAQTVRIGGLV
jgi:hypothetical protein